mgnify:CR=1 FL=1
MRNRIYLDFDGVVSPLVPCREHGLLLAVNGDCIPVSVLVDFRSNSRAEEIIWATHREDAVYDVTDRIGWPRFPHLTFTDPTGSKVKDILAHYTANPCNSAVVFEDSLTTAEIQALNAAGLTVRLFDNCIHQSTHRPEGK